jgi:hypothetical protein
LKARRSTLTDEATPAADGSESELTSKEAIYGQIADWVKEKTDKNIGKTGGRALFDMVHNATFAAATRDGTFRFNGGFGSYHVRKYGEGSRRLPSGATTNFGERQKLRYEQGVVTTALIKNGGDLTQALAVRGSRAQSDDKAAGKGKTKEKAAPAAAAEPAQQPAAAEAESMELD